MIHPLPPGGLAPERFTGATALPSPETPPGAQGFDASSALQRANGSAHVERSDDGARSPVDKKSHEAALQFEGILVRELLAPLEKSLSKGMGDQSASPMIGGMIVNSLGQSIIDGGGLGLAAVIEESMRASTVEKVSPTDGLEARQNSLPVEKPGT